MTTSLIVIGSLNADIVASGLERFPHPGEHVYGKDLAIGPGGKSRNIADMAARLMEPDTVAMLGRTAKDVYGFWKIPMEALQKSGVNTDFVVLDETTNKLPAIALIAVDQSGNNQIIVLPGASNDFSPEDIDKANSLFAEVVQNNGLIAITLECPIEVVSYATEKAKALGLKIIFDPGGITDDIQLEDLLRGVYLIKP